MVPIYRITINILCFYLFLFSDLTAPLNHRISRHIQDSASFCSFAFLPLSTGLFQAWISSGISMKNHTIGSAQMIPQYPSTGTSKKAIAIFPTISMALDTIGVL